jgi:hypothetical protein
MNSRFILVEPRIIPLIFSRRAEAPVATFMAIGRSRSILVIAGLTAFCLTGASFGAVPRVFALSEPAYCTTLAGSWDGVSTCTFTGPYTLSSGTLEITSGTVLVVTGGLGITVGSGASITVDSGGAITIKNAVVGGITVGTGATMTVGSGSTVAIENSLAYGIDDMGTLANSGTIDIKNVGSSDGIYDPGTVTNSGTITIENAGNVGVFIPAGGLLTNTGTIDIKNPAFSYGIMNHSTINNFGTITIEITGGIGLDNFGAVTNECGGVVNGSIIEESGGSFIQLTRCATVPEFAIPGLGPLALIAAALPALLFTTRRLRRSSG